MNVVTEDNLSLREDFGRYQFQLQERCQWFRYHTEHHTHEHKNENLNLQPDLSKSLIPYHSDTTIDLYDHSESQKPQYPPYQIRTDQDNQNAATTSSHPSSTTTFSSCESTLHQTNLHGSQHGTGSRSEVLEAVLDRSTYDRGTDWDSHGRWKFKFEEHKYF